MELCEGLRGADLLCELKKHSVLNRVSEKLNKSGKWIAIIEQYNRYFENHLHAGDYERSLNPAKNLILELSCKAVMTIEDFVRLLEGLELFEELSPFLPHAPVRIVQEPGDTCLDWVQVSLSGDLELRCTASGNPLPTFEWWRENSALDNQNTPGLVITTTIEKCQVESCLRISNMSDELQGKYFCIVSSEKPNAPKINSRDVDVKIKYCKPQIIEQPQNRCIIETEPFNLTCKAIGYPTPEYQWYLNDQKIFDQQDSTLKKRACNLKQSGKYKCVVSNAAGSTDSEEVNVTISKEILRHIEPNKRLKALEKVALLIGNEGGNLEKPVDDILLLERKLTSVDFKVIPLINLGFDDMLEALKMFSDLLKKGVYAFFYYAGHGCHSKSEALIPHYEVHKECSSISKHCTSYCIAESSIKDLLLKNDPKLRVVILDMCLKILDCQCISIPNLSECESSKSDLNYVVARATSKNLSSYETKSQPNGTYMTELSKYIDPNCGYTILSIINEVSKVISEKEDTSVNSENKKQIPGVDTNLHNVAATFLDEVEGDFGIKSFFNTITTPPENIDICFKNVDGLDMKATISFSPYKKFILNALLMVVDNINFEVWKLRVDAEKDVVGMENVIKATNKPNEFEIHHLQKLKAGINLSLFLLDINRKIISSTEIFIKEALIAKGF